MAKETRIELVSVAGIRRKFSVEHAERMFARFGVVGSGWAFPEGSRYEYVEGHVRRKKDTGDTKERTE